MRQVTVHVAHEELEYAPLVVPMNHVIDILKIVLLLFLNLRQSHLDLLQLLRTL